MEPVVIEFLFYEPCPVCPPSKLYLHNNQVVEAIQTEYGSKVLVKRIDFFSLEGQEKVEQYGIELGCQNTIVLNYEKVIGGYANETYVRGVVDAYLYELVHDVSVIKVMPSHSVIVVGEKINITVTLKNAGIERRALKLTFTATNP
ncbi:hypothetical protein KAU88_02150 [Candidatus Bathyarchaeota archaeon]|nr:hypothetical protein [Candidatus Bathyarchaeota archaeon]